VVGVIAQPYLDEYFIGTALGSRLIRQGSSQTLAVRPCPRLTDAILGTSTCQRCAEGSWLSREAMGWFWDSYLPDQGRQSEVTASPLQASPEQLRGLPPALIINGEQDVLRDEGEACARRLSRAGVPVTQVRYGGTIHTVLLNPITHTVDGMPVCQDQVSRARERTIAARRKLSTQ